jgi:hypothetical protein
MISSSFVVEPGRVEVVDLASGNLNFLEDRG